ncbi:hypothetical protein [Cryptosporangium sp. NPDC051539]|uniref:hypothetical protein n=1 Tax=Cryptosporangium sp. NPDC051539 TaxID=3363962 RepID=UPI0037BDB4E7
MTPPTPPPTVPPTPPAGPDPVALAGLARQVEALQRQAADVQDTPDKLDQLAKDVVDLTKLVQELLEGAPNRPRPSWICPAKPLTDETAGKLLADLLRWVELVYLEYPDGAESLTGCWLWHPHAVEELLWLRHAHDEAYAGPRASSNAVGDWHDRYRPAVARRVKTALNGCSVERHVAGGPRRDKVAEARAVAGAAPLGRLVEPIALWWSVNRDAEPPQPTPEQLRPLPTHVTTRLNGDPR